MPRKIVEMGDLLLRHLVLQLQRSKFLLAHHQIVHQDELLQASLINHPPVLALCQLLLRPRQQQLRFIRIG
jgi:hypothetical protein